MGFYKKNIFTGDIKIILLKILFQKNLPVAALFFGDTGTPFDNKVNKKECFFSQKYRFVKLFFSTVTAAGKCNF